MPFITLFCFLPIDITLSLLALQDLYDEHGNMKTATAGRSTVSGADCDSVDEALLGRADGAVARAPARTPKMTPTTTPPALSSTAAALTLPGKWSVAGELKTGGLAAMLASLTGGLGVTYFALSPSRIANDCGATSNVASITALAVCAVTMLAGSQIVAYMPPFYVGGLLFYAGIGYILDGVADGLRHGVQDEEAMISIFRTHKKPFAMDTFSLIQEYL